MLPSESDLDDLIAVDAQKWKASIDVMASVGTTRRTFDTESMDVRLRSKRVFATVGAVVVIILVVSVTATMGYGHSTRASSTSKPSIGTLINVDWALSSVSGHSVVGSHPFVLRVDGSFRSDLDACDSLVGQAHFYQASAVFKAKVVNHTCPSLPNDSMRRGTISEGRKVALILSGTVAWHASPRALTFTRKNVGSLTYMRGPVDPPSKSR